MTDDLQPQLLKMALDPTDIVYTPDWVARDMVEYFKPSGRILEPCKGGGVFLRYLPSSTEWCEIEEGRDFFAWREPVNWIVGNPPYAAYSKWISHSMKIAENILYLIPCNKPFNSWRLLGQLDRWGGLRHMRVYGGGAALGFPIGFAIGAVYFKRDWHAGMTISHYGKETE